MKNKYKLIIGIVVFIIATTIFLDWDNFKAGLLEKPPVVEVDNTK
jgi:hypothetical protein